MHNILSDSTGSCAKFWEIGVVGRLTVGVQKFVCTQDESQAEHVVSSSEGTVIYEDEQSMAEWEHVDAGSLAAVDLESPCEIVKTDDAIFAVPAVPPLKHTPDEPPDVDLYDLVEQMSYQNESNEEVRKS